MSEKLALGLLRAEIEDAKDLTNSNYKAVMAEVWIGHMTANNRKSKIKGKDQSRTIYLYDEAKREDWEDYAAELQKCLQKKRVAKHVNIAQNVKTLNNI